MLGVRLPRPIGHGAPDIAEALFARRQPLLGRLALGDVAHRPDDTENPSLAVPDRTAAVLHPDPFPRPLPPPPHPVLALRGPTQLPAPRTPPTPPTTNTHP